MTVTITLPIETIAAPERTAPRPCPLAPKADDDGCKHPSGSCKPEGCSAC